MNFRVTVFLFLLFFTSNKTVFSQEAAIVAVMPSNPVVVAKGQTTQLSVTAKIRKGFHIPANPAADEFLIPTTLTLQSSAGIVPGKPIYPPGQTYRLKAAWKTYLPTKMK